MNTIVPAPSSAAAVASTKPGGQQPAQSDPVESWDETYAGARVAADRNSDSQQSASPGSVTAGRIDGEQAKAASAPQQPRNAQPHSAIGTVMARQGTLPFTGSNSPTSNQSNGPRAAVPPPSSAGDDIAADAPTTSATAAADPTALEPTASDPTLESNSQSGTATAVSHRKPTDGGTTGSTARQASRSPGTPDDVHVDQQDRADRPAEDDKAADQDASTDSNAMPASSKPGELTSPGQSRANKIALHSAQTKHAPSDASSSGMPAATTNSQVALSQAALAANSSNGTDPAKKPDDRDSIAMVASATSGTVAPPLPGPPTVHGAAAAQDPDAPAQELLHHTAANLAIDSGGTARIVLTPPTLGHVEVRVTMEASGAAHIAITAATADGYAALTASHAGLLQHLAHRGVQVGSVQTQLQGDAGHNGTSGGGGRQGHNHPAPAATWVKKGQDETVIAYA